MKNFKFGDVLCFKKDWTLNYITFEKGELVRVAFQDHKYGIELVHPQIRGVFEFRYSPHTKERLIEEYLEKVDSCTGCIHNIHEEDVPDICKECSRWCKDNYEQNNTIKKKETT